ncbi:hypothetical protein CHRY9390_01166 [Chryseobacterium aquaeductus]|uniref:Uncharacterized protein n=1 Tax=Chryseobacterium aquaeductus TaxID=2675056 RepID=A0A9N8MFF3_9FLAO|nr:hypothetical protein [Chryseobacterium aquaeductus]CAA7330495.1 hypothetical protein CHRY9390_01166 [Chryseobacterium potabilaquae]CAD7804037.1 hypothetical protein CHRY9390_01166 [Chryseobacterium aquaeductus]
MIRKKINQIIVLVIDLLAFAKLKLYHPPRNEKSLLVNFENPQLYHRFFYLMLKFYQLSGYNIYYPMSFSKFRNLRNKDRYLGLILREKKFLSINKNNLTQDFIEINDKMFSPDYFLNYFEKGNQESKCFHVPMSFHPFMYNQQIWDNAVDTEKERLNSIFCYGNFDSKAYLDINRTEFNVISRTELLKFFEQKEQFVSIHHKEDITSETTDQLNEKFIFAIKENYPVAMGDLRELLSNFNFHLCCPGVVMPLCHNIIEAMSVGTIPLIEKEYAEVMYPNLQHKINAIIFKDLRDLNKILSEQLFDFSEMEISYMRKNVLEYYENFLMPESVVNHLNESITNKKLIYLQAEHRSVKFKN